MSSTLKSKHLYLIGLRGTGKTTVAELLSKRLNLPWIDTDRQIEAASGASIRELFMTRGEAYFRGLETEAIHLVPDSPPQVVSLGGGAILSPSNRDWIRATGHAVWLRASIDTMAERILEDEKSASSRPALTGRSVRDEIAQLSEQRRCLYEQMASSTVDTDGRTPEEVCEEIVSWWHCLE